MAEKLNHIDAPSDAELISRVRSGDTEAYGTLFARHVDSARRLAQQLLRGPDSEDLVSEAFTKVMRALQGGGGPDLAFRPYLLTAVRRLHVDRIRAQSRLTTSEDLSEFDPGVPFQDTVVEQFESKAAARAFAALPERWQMVLWHLEVEQQKPAEVAPLLGMTPNSVSALAYRAREGLRQAFLSAHLADIEDTECTWTAEHLGGFVRQGLAKRDAARVETHLQGCRSCTAMHLELVEVNSNLSGVLAPLLLGGLAAGYLSTAASGAAATGGVVALLDRAKDFVAAHVVPVSAGTTAAGVAAAVIITGGLGGGRSVAEADVPPSAEQSRASVASDGPTQEALQRSRPDEPRSTAGPERGRPGAGDSSEGSSKAPPTEEAPDEDGPSGDGGPAPGTEASVAPPSVGPTKQPKPSTQPSTQPSKPPSSTPSPTPTQTTPAGQDIALTLAGSSLSKGIGRFRTHVQNLPTASGPSSLILSIAFSRSDVKLSKWPKECTGSAAQLSCTSTGGSWNGIFDADMTALKPGETVTITVRASLSGVPDPDGSDNVRSLTLKR
jgi:RNA polymerase sigma factor (sigma-70 family)